MRSPSCLCQLYQPARLPVKHTHAQPHTERDGTRVFQPHRNTLTLGPVITSWISSDWMTHHVDISVWRDQWMKTRNCTWNTDPLVKRLLFHFGWVWSYCTMEACWRPINSHSVVLQTQRRVSHLGNAKHIALWDLITRAYNKTSLQKKVCLFVCLFVCVCVFKKEKRREIQIWTCDLISSENWNHFSTYKLFTWSHNLWVCVRVCFESERRAISQFSLWSCFW